jgi:single-stranded-DNA-specific exonuclease
MQRQTTQWHFKSDIPTDVEQALSEYHPILRKILFNRGYTNAHLAQKFLEAKPLPGTDPQGMLGIPEATQRIIRAIHAGTPIAVYGDYDADGVTATALLVHTLEILGATVMAYIPNRFTEGYGLNLTALDFLHAEGIRQIITVDCGIRSLAEADHASALGIELIITDHHQPGSELPQASAIINPKQEGDQYPEKELSGAGLAYKLADALLSEQKSAPQNSKDLLDLVAIGTVADLVPLRGENRFLVREGLMRLRRPRRQGLMALMGIAGLPPARVQSSDIGYIIGPRINAAGRLASAHVALQLLLTTDRLEAGRLAQQLDNHNRERQRITRQIQLQAEEMAFKTNADPRLLFAADESFNPGVIGLAASRLGRSFYRPAIVAHIGEKYARASCRSIPEFHITEALDHCADLLKQYGGHAAAAGFTVLNSNLPALLARLNEAVDEKLKGIDLIPTLYADAEVQLPDLSFDLLDQLALIEPTGSANEEALFITRNLRIVRSRTVGKDRTHLKLTVTDGKDSMDAIAFRQGYWQSRLPPRVDLIYNFETNEFRGQTSLQLNVRDIKKAD